MEYKSKKIRKGRKKENKNGRGGVIWGKKYKKNWASNQKIFHFSLKKLSFPIFRNKLRRYKEKKINLQKYPHTSLKCLPNKSLIPPSPHAAMNRKINLKIPNIARTNWITKQYLQIFFWLKLILIYKSQYKRLNIYWQVPPPPFPTF